MKHTCIACMNEMGEDEDVLYFDAIDCKVAVHPNCFNNAFTHLERRFGPGLGDGFIVAWLLVQKFRSLFPTDGSAGCSGSFGREHTGAPELLEVDAGSGTIPSVVFSLEE